ncbi:tripartite tricarboxylate transporter substrate binding protein [Xylophilus sp. GOD-11R]|uniref:Bug family tripartite tricarboxylate transporter substrate binding protein n=1 Tax=Xylophilus sp. GOD-11R TaxID=3089814 RepID=UPI00298C0B65|nr:tripartite tricarboxylate transporter substrate binding protein [Xylophilus sp. GOD-11R]WPB55506.1 tripartite tricarboxylate transporter substrate binding protein [Xylophilus sp. GOD-11R]
MWKSFAGAALLSLASLQSALAADPFPSRPITIVVGVAPGGSLDALARLIASQMSVDLKQSVVVENTTGAGGLVGFQKLMKSEPNGYTLMFSNSSMVLIPLMFPKAGLDVVDDTTPIGHVANVPMVLAVSSKSGIQDLGTLMTQMKAPGAARLNFGSGGPGTTSHLAEAVFIKMVGGQGELVAYRGSGPALADVMAGTIEGIIDQTVTLTSLHTGKRLKALAVSSPQRTAQLPDVPTFAEAGLPQFDLQIWNGLVGPRGLPPAVAEVLQKSIRRIVESPDWKERIGQLGAEVPPAAELGPEALRQTLQSDQKKLAGMASELNLQAR